MRILIKMHTEAIGMYLTINYNHALSSIIYETLNTSSKHIPSFLNNKEHLLDNDKFRLFTFSNLFFNKYKIEDQTIKICDNTIHWYISSPIKEFILNLTRMLLKQHYITINNIKFVVDKVIELRTPTIKDNMRFKALSSLTVSALTQNEDKPIYYIRHYDPEFSDAVKENLIKKHKQIKGYEPQDTTFKLEFDNEYITKRFGKIQKKITCKGIDIIGVLSPFRATGNPELIKIGYEAGFGEKGCKGFGMAEIITE
ncbi:CRISPR-associated protein Cas6 [Candidatus Magnetoovum chiemensis]|nr:CRISPR-associated protein Cas6 [Candidatus Magnetoovum chiemensis]